MAEGSRLLIPSSRGLSRLGDPIPHLCLLLQRWGTGCCHRASPHTTSLKRAGAALKLPPPVGLRGKQQWQVGKGKKGGGEGEGMENVFEHGEEGEVSYLLWKL